MRVTTVPTSTTNMTGFLTWTRGVELVEGVDQCLTQDLAVEEAPGLAPRRVASTSLAQGQGLGCVMVVIRRTFRG